MTHQIKQLKKEPIPGVLIENNYAHGREGARGETEREAGREGGARAKPGNQLVKYKQTLSGSVVTYLSLLENSPLRYLCVR